MAIALFDASLIIARLQAQVSALKLVAGAADLAAASEAVKQLPCAFVLPLSERTGRSSTGTMIVSQHNESRFGVVIAAQNLRDPRGQQAQVDVRTLRAACMTALLGWTPDANSDPCEYGGGRLLELDNLVLWWQDEYITGTLLRSA